MRLAHEHTERMPFLSQIGTFLIYSRAGLSRHCDRDRVSCR